MKALFAAAIIGIAGVALAQGDSMTGKSEQTPSAKGSKSQGLYQESQAFEIEGTVAKKSKNSVTITRENLPPANLKIHEQTQITLNGQKVNANSLSEGTQVRARFQLDNDQPVAVTIEAQPSSMEKMKEVPEQMPPEPAPEPGSTY
ncbi:MAG: hypothetical protein ACYC8T_28115 [Myxococcaceae bacterium]